VQVILSGVAGLWALGFFAHRRHADDAKFMKDLLTDFNNRYDTLNNDLQRAIWRDEPFEPETKLSFIKYFNLCAEEWLFRQTGYIYDPVWVAWENGMRQYSGDKRVRDLWREEQKSNSYYGFELPSGEQAGRSEISE